MGSSNMIMIKLNLFNKHLGNERHFNIPPLTYVSREGYDLRSPIYKQIEIYNTSCACWRYHKDLRVSNPMPYHQGKLTNFRNHLPMWGQLGELEISLTLGHIFSHIDRVDVQISVQNPAGIRFPVFLAVAKRLHNPCFCASYATESLRFRKWLFWKAYGSEKWFSLSVTKSKYLYRTQFYQNKLQA